MVHYVKVFLLSGVGLGLFYHWVTREPMPWWPDTVIVGAFMGGMGALVAKQVRMDRRSRKNISTAFGLAWRYWRTR